MWRGGFLDSWSFFDFYQFSVVTTLIAMVDYSKNDDHLAVGMLGFSLALSTFFCYFSDNNG